MTNPPSGADWSQAGQPQPPKKRGPRWGVIIALVLGVIAIVAVTPFVFIAMGLSGDTDESMVVVTDDEAATTAESGEDTGAGATAEPAVADDMDAKVDASTLGKEIATYFVDNTEPPVVEQQGDIYLVDDVTITASPGVELLGFSATDWSDWCVWVHAAGGDVRDYQYSAVGGLEQGTCS